jgi:D-glycero-beta-D-manno-heptose-7-phosphate kinase
VLRRFCVNGWRELIDRFKDRRICVVGDIIADVYIYGKPHKLSREAPVVVVKYEEEKTYPGSAGNTINNLIALGARVFPVGCLGKDDAGDWLMDYFCRHSTVEPTGLVRHDGRTVTKTRILAGDTHTSKQQVIRVDKESEGPISGAIRADLLARLADIIPRVDAIILSDYEYGLIDAAIIEQVIDMARGKIVVGDSRYNLQRFSGITLITPNESEAYELAGLDSRVPVEEVGARILASMSLGALLITRGNKGMCLFLKDGKVHHIPIWGGDEIADVTGAGDTVASAVTLSLASGADFYTASMVANYAAGVVVMKRGTAVVTADELRKVIEGHGTLDS